MSFTEAKYSGKWFTLPGFIVWFKAQGTAVIVADHPNRPDLVGQEALLWMTETGRNDWMVQS